MNNLLTILQIQLQMFELFVEVQASGGLWEKGESDPDWVKRDKGGRFSKSAEGGKATKSPRFADFFQQQVNAVRKSFLEEGHNLDESFKEGFSSFKSNLNFDQPKQAIEELQKQVNDYLGKAKEAAKGKEYLILVGLAAAACVGIGVAACALYGPAIALIAPAMTLPELSAGEVTAFMTLCATKGSKMVKPFVDAAKAAASAFHSQSIGFAALKIENSITRMFSNVLKAYRQKFLVKRSIERGADDFTFYDLHLAGKNIGYAAVKEVDNKSIFLDGLQVLPTHQGQGYGSLLLKEVIKHNKDKIIRLKVSPFGNEAMNAEQLKRFYSKMGFQKVGTKDGEDIMQYFGK